MNDTVLGISPFTSKTYIKFYGKTTKQANVPDIILVSE